MTKAVGCAENFSSVVLAGYETVRSVINEARQAVEDLSDLRLDERRQLIDTLRQVFTATQLARDFLIAVDDFGTLAHSDNMTMMLQDVKRGDYDSLNIPIDQMVTCLCAAERKYQEATKALNQADREIDRSIAVLDRAAARAGRREQQQRSRAEGSAILGVAGVIAGFGIGLVAPGCGCRCGRWCWSRSYELSPECQPKISRRRSEVGQSSWLFPTP